jgi:predicted nucleotidyltransferase
MKTKPPVPWFFDIIQAIFVKRSTMNREETLQKLLLYKQENHQKYGIDVMGIFGSLARDEASSQSDVDIVIQMQRADMFALVHIKEELQALLNRTVDIVRLRPRMNPYLKKRIDQEAIYV